MTLPVRWLEALLTGGLQAWYFMGAQLIGNVYTEKKIMPKSPDPIIFRSELIQKGRIGQQRNHNK